MLCGLLLMRWGVGGIYVIVYFNDCTLESYTSFEYFLSIETYRNLSVFYEGVCKSPCNKLFSKQMFADYNI